MILWHGYDDTPRLPEQVPAGSTVQIWIGTYPIEPEQDIAVSYEVFRSGVKKASDVLPAHWHHNDDNRGNSHWLAELGPFKAGETVEYSIAGVGPDGPIEEQSFTFSVVAQAVDGPDG